MVRVVQDRVGQKILTQYSHILQNMNTSIIKNALMNALAAALYITAIATFLSHAEKILR